MMLSKLPAVPLLSVPHSVENLVPITAEDHTSNNIPSTILENHSHIYEPKNRS